MTTPSSIGLIEPRNSHSEYRKELVKLFRRQVFGPSTDLPPVEQQEVLQISPLQLYATGVLFAQRLPVNLLEDSAERPANTEEDVADGDLGAAPVLEARERSRDSDTGPSTGEREPLNLANEFSPSAAGITFRLAGPTQIEIRITYGRYESETVAENHPRAGSTRSDGDAISRTSRRDRIQASSPRSSDCIGRWCVAGIIASAGRQRRRRTLLAPNCAPAP